MKSNGNCRSCGAKVLWVSSTGGSKPRYAADTTVPVERSRAEIEATVIVEKS